MEQTTVNALEQVDNPILVILLVVLITGIIAIFRRYLKTQQELYDLAVETVGALKDINARLAQMQQHSKQHEA